MAVNPSDIDHAVMATDGTATIVACDVRIALVIAAVNVGWCTPLPVDCTSGVQVPIIGIGIVTSFVAGIGINECAGPRGRGDVRHGVA